MSNVRKQHVFCIAIVLAITIVAAAPSSHAFAAWEIGAPIVTHWSGDLPLTDALAQWEVAGGYNMVYVNGDSPESLATQLAVAQKYGLRAQLYNKDLLTPTTLNDSTKLAQLNALIDVFKASPAGYCYFCADEPKASAFTNLGALTSYISQRDPNHLSYINLLGSYTTPYNLGAASYSTYLNKFVSTVKPSLLSYDNYQLMAGGDTHWYFDNLAQVRSAAKTANLPFMNIVQACQWDSGWRLPTGDQMRFLVYTTLAYGGQGISYFNYYTPTANTGGLKPVDDTAITMYNNLTPLNHEFAAISAELQPLVSIGAYHLGMLPPGTTKLPAASPFHLLEAVADQTYYDGNAVKGVLFGLFGNDDLLADASYAMVINLDYTASKTYTLVGPGDLQVFDATLGVWTSTGSNQAVLNLLPGGGELVRVMPIPEPSTIALLASTLAGLFLFLRHRRTS